jgi:hypothetical protein
MLFFTAHLLVRKVVRANGFKLALKIKIEACPPRNDSGKCPSLKDFIAVIGFGCLIRV